MKWGIELSNKDDQKHGSVKTHKWDLDVPLVLVLACKIWEYMCHRTKDSKTARGSRYACIFVGMRQDVGRTEFVRWIPALVALVHKSTIVFECVLAKLLCTYIVCITLVDASSCASKCLEETNTILVRLYAVGHLPTRTHRGWERVQKIRGMDSDDFVDQRESASGVSRGWKLGHPLKWGLVYMNARKSMIGVGWSCWKCTM